MIDMLSYIGFRSPDHAAWIEYGRDVLGLEVTDAGIDGAVRLRMDDAAYRIAVHPAESNDIAYLGWGVSGPRQFAAALDRLTLAGVAVIVESAALAGERLVAELVSFVDPFGLRNELSWGQVFRPSTFRPGRSHHGFVTGAGGLGHAVLVVPKLEVAEAFYVDTLGFTLTDQIQRAGAPRLRFYNCNERHHTLAMVEVPGMVGFHHLMLEVADLDDVGVALDRTLAGDGEVTMTLGRHTNDRMTSFYLRTPAAFEIEYGWGGVVLDDPDDRLPRRYDSFSIWGHKPPSGKMTPPGIIRPVAGAEPVGATQ